MSDDFSPEEAFDLQIEELVHETPKATRESIAEASALPLKHFRLTSHPFADSVNPEYFFRTEAHEEAFLAMKQCIEDRISIGITTAISGTGKTLLTQVLMQELDPRQYQTILVLAYPGMSRTALLQEVLGELGVTDIGSRAKIHDLIGRVQQYIIDQYMRGIRLVIIIDEVHFLQADALHMLRTLSNIEHPDHKLVTILLFGEQSFLSKMQHPSYRAIFSRMFARTEIRPLFPGEMEQYIKFRLLVAGGRPDIFPSGLMELMHRNSSGLPREINRICHNALALAAREGLPQVTEEIVRRIPAALSIERG